MAPTSRVIPSYEYRRTRWRNGGGWTREIHAEPAGEGEWDWRLSIAEITADGPFSTFPGVDRELVLLAGEGLRLRFEDDTAELKPPYGRHRFAGESPVHGELVAGPTHDFNLMWRRDRYVADLWRRPLVGAMVVFAEPRSTWVVHQLAGGARFADASGLPDLAMGDTAILQAGEARLRHVLDGAGEALLIRLHPADAPPSSNLELAPLG
ncbi:HutD/Ves family protein [Lysobacter xanthus]